MTNLERIKQECKAIIDLHKPLTEYAAEELEIVFEWFEERDFLLDGASVFWEDEMESLCIERAAKNIQWTLIFDSTPAIEHGIHMPWFEAGGNYNIMRDGEMVACGGGANPLHMIEPVEKAFFSYGYQD